MVNRDDDVERTHADGGTEGSVVDRRSYLKGTATLGTGAALSTAGCLGSFGGGGGGAIQIGTLIDQSGWAAFVGNIALPGVRLAVQENTDDGTLNGREVDVLSPDPASDNNKYQNLANKLILEDQVDVLIGALASSAREAIRPTVDEEKQLYFYFMSYEGGLCDEYTFLTGSAASQKVKPVVDFMVDEFGPSCYIMSADYNFGHISALWTKYFLDQAGGEVAGEEFVPVDVSEFGSTINRIRGADPDWVMTIIVSSENMSFFKQADSSGLDVPMGSPNLVSVGFEHQRLSPPVLSNTYFSTNYVQEFPGDANQEFVSKWNESFPDVSYVNQSGFGSYVATKLYLQAVEEAGTTDQQEVHSTIEDGMTVSAAGMDLEVHPPTHHLDLDVKLGRINEDHGLEFMATQTDVSPVQLPDHQCTLDQGSTWDDPTTEQITPEEGDF